MNDDESPTPRRSRVRTHCPDCYGSGSKHVERAYASQHGNVGTMVVPQKCKTCEGSGRLEGMQPPI